MFLFANIAFSHYMHEKSAKSRSLPTGRNGPESFYYHAIAFSFYQLLENRLLQIVLLLAETFTNDELVL
jgi:hypothetical protein